MLASPELTGLVRELVSPEFCRRILTVARALTCAYRLRERMRYHVVWHGGAYTPFDFQRLTDKLVGRVEKIYLLSQHGAYSFDRDQSIPEAVAMSRALLRLRPEWIDLLEVRPQIRNTLEEVVLAADLLPPQAELLPVALEIHTRRVERMWTAQGIGLPSGILSVPHASIARDELAARALQEFARLMWYPKHAPHAFLPLEDPHHHAVWRMLRRIKKKIPKLYDALQREVPRNLWFAPPMPILARAAFR